METHTFAAAQAGRLLGRLTIEVGATSHSPDAEAVHDLRVAIRRFTQALAVFKPWIAPAERKKMRSRLKAIMTLAGEVRDCDVALRMLAASRAAGATALASEVGARRKSIEKRLLGALRRWGARKLEAGEVVQEAHSPPVEEFAWRELRRLAKRFFQKGGRAAASDSTARELHEFRLAAKSFRYTVELFAGLYGRTSGGWLDRIKNLQTLLGAINDCRAVRRLAASLGGSPEIDASLRRKQRRKAREFRRLWADQFASPGVARQWLQGLRRPPRKPVTRGVSEEPGASALEA